VAVNLKQCYGDVVRPYYVPPPFNSLRVSYTCSANRDVWFVLFTTAGNFCRKDTRKAGSGVITEPLSSFLYCSTQGAAYTDHTIKSVGVMVQSITTNDPFTIQMVDFDFVTV